jgi:branched-chain amino acid transport system permease protein
MKYRVIAFTVAGVFTGFAGAFYAHFLEIITPNMLGLMESIQVMIMSIVGGVSSLVAGPMVGAGLLKVLSAYLLKLPVFGIRDLVFGGAVVLILVFSPKGSGLVDLWTKFWKKIFKEIDLYDAMKEIRRICHFWN